MSDFHPSRFDKDQPQSLGELDWIQAPITIKQPTEGFCVKMDIC